MGSWLGNVYGKGLLASSSKSVFERGFGWGEVNMEDADSARPFRSAESEDSLLDITDAFGTHYRSSI